MVDRYAVFLVLCFAGWVGAASINGVTTTETYKQSIVLDQEGNYLLFWKFNEKNVTFEVHVKTRGWVGLGISTNGNMYPADVAFGWVKDGVAHFQDRHNVAHAPPVLDKSQDWHLLQAFENDFGTVLKFVRDIDTCDSAEDEVIQEGTVRLIYAYNPDDPTSDDSLIYHGSKRRGTKSVSLLSESVMPSDFPPDVKYYEFLNHNFLMPAVDTYYQCTGFQMPDFGGKHHMIMYEPVITPGNELHVHHILLYRCKGISPSSDGAGVPCYDNRPTDILPYCSDVVIAWAIGGEPFYFPDHVGFPVGSAEDPSFYIMETHYDNPNKVAGLIDNSGIRMALTKTLRQYDIGMLEVGHEVNWRHMIPPHQPAYISKSYCSENCITRALAEMNYTEVKAIAAFQHAHLLGVGIKTRHFRNGKELPPLMNDPNYDFDFQETRMLQHERVIRSGDSFMVECTYDSRKRQGLTFGGLSTKDEMCLTFLYYYPKSNLYKCISSPDIAAGLGVPKHQISTQITAVDWSNKTQIDTFMAKIESAPVFHECSGSEMKPPYSFERFMETETQHPYTPPNVTCGTR